MTYNVFGRTLNLAQLNSADVDDNDGGVQCNDAVCDGDFPSTSCIRRRVDQFQTQFSRDLVTLFTSLTETVQLNTLSIAVTTHQPRSTVSCTDRYIGLLDNPTGQCRPVGPILPDNPT